MENSELIRHYQSLLAEHGAGPQALQWADRETQFTRFAVLYDVAPKMQSVLDVGCGLGDFRHFLRARGSDARFHGVDIVPEFIELASQAFADDPLASASKIEPEGELPKGYDYAILSGAFNNRMDDNWGFVTATLRRMWGAAEKGIAFNAMTSHVDYQDEGLWYVDPMKLFGFCKTELSGHPVLRHDYTVRENGFPFEFAIYVYKEPNIGATGR